MYGAFLLYPSPPPSPPVYTTLLTILAIGSQSVVFLLPYCFNTPLFKSISNNFSNIIICYCWQYWQLGVTKPAMNLLVLAHYVGLWQKYFIPCRQKTGCWGVTEEHQMCCLIMTYPLKVTITLTTARLKGCNILSRGCSACQKPQLPQYVTLKSVENKEFERTYHI